MRRSRPLGRKENTRAPKITFYIYCEGENTEPGYIDALRAAHPEWLVELEPIRGPGAPANLVRSAKSKLEEIRRKSTKTKQSFEGQDQVWALFDDDARKTIPDALDQARVHGVGIGYSNPCFELWLILHQCDFDKVLPHKAVQKHFEKICPEYQRTGGKIANFPEMMGRLDDAVCRAQRLEAAREKDGNPLENPSTTVHHLIKALREADAKFRGK
jgi:hypothetical protein